MSKAKSQNDQPRKLSERTKAARRRAKRYANSEEGRAAEARRAEFLKARDEPPAPEPSTGIPGFVKISPELHRLLQEFARENFTLAELTEHKNIEIGIADNDSGICYREVAIVGAGPSDSSDEPSKLPVWEDRGETVDLLVKAIRNHVPPSHPVRFRLADHLSYRDANGDFDELETPEQQEAILKSFRALPDHEKRMILNGWNPEVLDVDPNEVKSFSAGVNMVPALWIQSQDSPPRDGFDAQFWVKDGQSYNIIDLFIRAGSTKAQVMDAMDRLTDTIDHHWDRLISNPENKKAGER